MLFSRLAATLLAFSVAAGTAFAQSESNAAPAQTLFTNVDVFDGSNEALIQDANVLVEGNLIKTVSTEAITADGANVIDGGGRTMIPGLIDAHWHVNFSAITMAELLGADFAWITLKSGLGAGATLQRGFTTVRDVGGNVFSVKKAIDQNLIEGPRIYPSGAPIGQTSGHFDFRGYSAVPATDAVDLSYLERSGVVMRADGVPEVLLRARENLRMGASQLKIATGGGVSSVYDPLDVTEFTPAEVEAVVAAAENWGTYVASHTFTDRATQMAINAGVKSVEHGFLLSDETFQIMADRGVWLSIQPLLNDEDAFTFPDPVSTAKWIEVTNGTDAAYKAAKKYGVKTAFGTDILGDPPLTARQGAFLAKLKRWYTPFEVLKMATHDNAELLGLSGPRNPYQAGPLGVIAEGAYADLILVDGNPLENIDLLADPDTNFDLIMKDGKVFKNTLE